MEVDAVGALAAVAVRVPVLAADPDSEREAVSKDRSSPPVDLPLLRLHWEHRLEVLEVRAVLLAALLGSKELGLVSQPYPTV